MVIKIELDQSNNTYSDKNKTLSIKEYLDETKPYLQDIINNLAIIMVIICIATKDTDEDCVMHSKTDNIEIMSYDKSDEVIKNFLSHFWKDIKLC